MKKILSALATTALFLQLNSCYLINQGVNLLKYNFSAIPLEQVYNDPRTSDKIKERIKLVFEIREFAINKLGLKQNKTYTKYVQLNDKNYLVNVVVGSKPDKLEAYEWKFPFFGAFPYKGFYNLREAKEEERRLKDLGYDTYIRTAGAFSTLGWFDDPIYSYMLNYSTEYLANIIIHEMTHATVFIPNNVQFNEEMANFVGEHGATEFLRYKFGENSNEYKSSFKIKEDGKKFSGFLNELHNALKKMYDDPNKSYEEKLKEKSEIIKDFKYNKFKEFEKTVAYPNNYGGFPKMKLNNAVIMGFITYEQDYSLYINAYDKLGQDLPKAMKLFKIVEQKSANNPKQFLRDYVDGKIEVNI
ncbi:MAG: aminopeptidase [Candidatus Sericytochromatia bacterium]